MTYRTKSKDKSVRDWTVTAEKDGDQVYVIFKFGRRTYLTMFISKNDWINPPGDTIGNRNYDRRELVRHMMESTGKFSFYSEEACLTERLADSCCTAMYKLMGGIS